MGINRRFGATVQQNCVISFVPVTTRIDEKITRRYVPEAIFEQVAEDEEIAEASGDDAMDILPAEIDLVDVFRETLVLALPDYPRAEGVELGERVFSEEGVNRCGMRMQNPLQALQPERKDGKRRLISPHPLRI